MGILWQRVGSTLPPIPVYAGLPECHEEIIAELRALYAKALPEQEPPLVEAVSDETADGSVENPPLRFPSNTSFFLPMAPGFELAAE